MPQTRSLDNGNLTQQFTGAQADAASRAKISLITVSSIDTEVKAVQSEVDSLNQQMTKLQAARDVQRKDFDALVADQRQLQKLLQDALDVLRKVYSTGLTVPTAAKSDAGKDAPPSFNAYGGGRAKGANVIALLEGLIRDAKNMELQAVAQQTQGQEQFDRFTAETNTALQAGSPRGSLSCSHMLQKLMLDMMLPSRLESKVYFLPTLSK